MSSEALRLADELEYLAHGRTEWRVQDPISKAYCISFDRASSLNPERDAREWLSSHVSNHPNSPKARYEVAQSLCFTYLEESARQAASLLRTQAARIASLEAERDQLSAEVNEQARLNGMGAERELALMAERDQLRAEVQHHIATRERLLLTLTSIHALMYPPPIKTPDGRTMVFRPNDPDPHTILQALSDRIHAIPDQIDRAIEAAKEAK